MKRTDAIVVSILLAACCRAQTALPPNSFYAPFSTSAFQPTPSHMDWVLFGQQNFFDQRPAEHPTGETVSAARLRHRPPGKAWKAFGRGLRFDQSGSTKAAADEFQKAVSIDPNFSEAIGNLGVENTQLGRLDEAAAQFRRAIELDPASGVHHANLAFVLIRARRLEEADPEAQTAVALDPANVKAQLILGFLLARKPETRDRAISHLEYAARRMPEAHKILAQLGREP